MVKFYNVPPISIGDIASRIVNYDDKRGGGGEVGGDDEPVQVTVVDVNPEMLREGEKKLSDKSKKI